MSPDLQIPVECRPTNGSVNKRKNILIRQYTPGQGKQYVINDKGSTIVSKANCLHHVFAYQCLNDDRNSILCA